MSNKNSPIGVFDSGIGGLTVVKSLMHNLPQENVVYFGDIARIPYGTKSVSTIKKFTEQTVRFLLNQDVKAIIIACNTISAVAKDTVLQLAGNIPVIDVISAGAKAATASANKIGVIATPATINSNAYPRAIQQLNPQSEVHSQACALFVNMIEEGFIKHPALDLIAAEYLNPLLKYKLEALILGCTHYPLITDTIAKIIGNDIKIIDPAITAVSLLQSILAKTGQLNQNTTINGNYRFYVTDVPIKFQSIGEMFLGHPMQHLEVVSVE